MTISIKEMKEEFYTKYPLLFPNGEPRCGFSCDVGWKNILDDAFRKLHYFLICTQEAYPDYQNECVVDQIKEKFGGLRLYLNGGYEADIVNDIIVDVEELSLRTCEFCGAPGYPRKGGWIKTKCDNCCKDDKKDL